MNQEPPAGGWGVVKVEEPNKLGLRLPGADGGVEVAVDLGLVTAESGTLAVVDLGFVFVESGRLAAVPEAGKG